jgi:hypothetical protein
VNPPLSPDLQALCLADSHDRAAWFKARSYGITATDAAHLCTERSIPGVVRAKTNSWRFTGNAYTDYGRKREPIIAQWMRTNYGIESNTRLFCSSENARHLATPDGITPADQPLLLAEIKTSTKPISALPRTYLRQIWWQQYVLGAERTLLVWEQQHDFHPVADHPEVRWITRDEAQIQRLVGLADRVIEELDRLFRPLPLAG